MYESEDIENVGIKSMEQLTEQPFLLGILITYAEQRGVSPALVLAIIEAESGGDSYAARYEPLHMTKLLATRPQHVSLDTEVVFQKTAWGLMQVMGATARELGFDGWLSELVVPETNIRLGVEFLRRKMSQYLDRDGIEGVAAAYNGGAPRRRPDGKFTNQGYVDKVMEAMGRYKATVEEFEGGKAFETSVNPPAARTERKKRKSGAAEETPPSGEAETEDRADGE